MSMQQRRFVVRMALDRAAERGGPRVSELLADARVVSPREVQSSERDKRADQHRGGGTSRRRRIPSALDGRGVFFREENHCSSKALKTGCSFEKRQFGSYQALLVALAAERMHTCASRRAHHDRATPDTRKTNAPDVMYSCHAAASQAGSRWVVGLNDA